MHGYCIGGELENRRKAIVGALVTLAIFLTPEFNLLIDYLISKLKLNEQGNLIVEWFTSKGISLTVSYVVVFWTLYGIINKLFWLTPFSAITGVPNVRGMWKGVLHSNYNGGTDIDMTLHIKQSWSKIQCSSIFEKSSSESIMARVIRKNDFEIQLEFAYFNKSQDAEAEQKEYYGFNYFTIRENKMTGFYFTNRDDGSGEKTYGHIELKKLTFCEMLMVKFGDRRN